MGSKKIYHILGLMSGSSLDGLDIAFCKFELDEGKINWEILQAETLSYDLKWKLRLLDLPHHTALDFAKTHTYFGHYMGELVNTFIHKHNIEADFIASHGHTIFHYPEKLLTVQIGDGAALASKTGLPVICDFRSHDLALEGEGTPLAPTADHYLFPEYDFLLNLGGIANITHQKNGKRTAFDITPLNQVLNELAMHEGLEYDEDGNLAQSGAFIPELYEYLNRYPYYHKPLPKSLDNQNIKKQFIPKVLNFESSNANKLHTCCKVFGYQIAQVIASFGVNDHSKILVTGGGAFNVFLMNCIQEELGKKMEIRLPSKEIIMFKEALLMALLGLLRVENNINCFSEITNALSDSIGGAIYQGIKKHI